MIGVQPYIEIVERTQEENPRALLGEGMLGEAPYWVRESLVGLKLPLIETHFNGLYIIPMMIETQGLLEGKNVARCSRWFADLPKSLGIIAREKPETARWFLSNLPETNVLELAVEDAILVE